ncbi:hypothetical protein [Microtetraspora malaysiensis]|uniref:Uncharacterized protein n=1 Tax=Microtetraspora malaysiensis TaxID=161358 RepID=A0ABW6SLH5_9ACTN
MLLDTPYAFQENAADISARARRYFARSVGLRVEVGGDGVDLAEAGWVFSGPGSPTYALRRWQASSVAGELRARVRARDGVTVLASAAACTAGMATVPVYEIYKVGAEPYWEEGLDLVAELGLRAVVIPHYDNAEGGTHDTRYCYLGERRLTRMEKELPDGAAVLGIDEHTAVVFDLDARTVEVAGRGGLTIRRRGSQTVLPTRTSLALAKFRGLVEGGSMPVGIVKKRANTAPELVTLGALIKECEQRFEAAVGAGDRRGATRAVLDLEEAIATWSADTEDEGGVDQARATVRHLVVRLGGLADFSEPRQRLAPLVEPLLALRGRLRERGMYEVADALRVALADGGVAVRDTASGPVWTVHPAK